MRKWVVQGLTPILCGLALLVSVIVAGRAARASLLHRAAYSLSFADIECQPPDGMSRADFLSEVRSLASQPAALHLLDDDLDARLHRAFLAHPWVESVHRVAIDANHSVRVEIEYRKAVLAVPSSPNDKSGWRLVDRRGVLLPAADQRAHLPILTADVSAPAGPPGSHWGDARVTAAAQTAALLRAHWSQLHLEDSQMEVIEGEIVIRKPGVRIVWGHAPGREKEDEAPAKVKLRRLLDYQKEHDGLESLEHDVRFLAYGGHFPLSQSEAVNTVSLYESSQSPSKTNRDQVSNSSRSWRSCFNDSNSPSADASSR